MEFPKRYLTNFYLKFGRDLRISNYIRAGIFPFFRRGSRKYFILSISSIGGELSDFAGKRDHGEFCWRKTAIRELREESSGLFNFSNEVLQNPSEIVYDGRCVFSFVELKLRFSKKILSKEFFENQKLFADKHFQETKGIFIVDDFQMKKLLRGETVNNFKLWSYLKLFFSGGKTWPVLNFNRAKHFVRKNISDGIVEYTAEPIKVE